MQVKYTKILIDGDTIAAIGDGPFEYDDKDMNIMDQRNITLVHNPSSDMKLGSGFARVKQASDVVMTMVDGEILFDHGDFLTMDKEAICYKAEQCAKRLLG